ncbi:MAG TPA: DUF885 domain-containing protein [Terriglobales bacterium]|jgi:uncharacterized protein (DUF885 family)|nr:DUF885 domain-containing protein [Terriglobales bacterium]
MQLRLSIFAVSLLYLLACSASRADDLQTLATDFWTWRAAEQPVSTDDIPRLERPAHWVPSWSPESVQSYRTKLGEFESRWLKLDVASLPIAQQVDYRLMGSAIARVRCELDVNRGWQRNPGFYIDQTVGAYFHLLLPPPPFDAVRTSLIVETLASIRTTLTQARTNLSDIPAPFASLAVDRLANIRSSLQQSVTALKPKLDANTSKDLDAKAQQAIQALEDYREWLQARVPNLPSETAVGRDSYIFFLKNVALIPYSPERLLEIGKDEWARSVSFQVYEEHRNQSLPQLALFKTEQEEIAATTRDELAVRRYLQEKQILSVPDWLQHYGVVPMPDYLAPLESFGETDDFTSPSRLKENSSRYINSPAPDLGYFALSVAKDPRAEIVHEGVPGHYFQLALSWAHPDPIRRHYYDSGANEGIGFYAEEMMLEAGLFDDSPRSREIIYNFMRLRALRVEVDVKLALGLFTIEQAAEYLEHTVPMDRQTARTEAAFFASSPGQAISYQIGKTQILHFLAEAQRKQKEKFSLQRFHDSLWLNGNVPIALQTWELLGIKDDLNAVDQLH